MEIFRKKNEATNITFPMVTTANPETFITGATVADTAYYSDAGGAFATLAISDATSEISTTGMYDLSLLQAEMNHDLIIIKFTATSAADTAVIIRTRAVDIDDLVRSTTPANTLDVSATGEAGIDWANIGSPTQAQNLSGTNIDVDQVVASVSGAVATVTAIAAGAIDNTSVGTLDNTNFAFVDANERVDVGAVLGTAQTAGDIPALVTTVDTVVDNLNLGIIYGTAQTGTLSTTVCTSDQAGNFADDELIGRVIVFTGGTADGQAAVITDYANTAGTITFSGGITTVPVNNDTFKIV